MTDKLRALEYDKQYLWVFKENYKARRFYEKMGFKFNGDEKSTEICGKKLIEVCCSNCSQTQKK